MRAVAVLLCALLLAGCEKLARNMYDGAKEKPLRPSASFDDGSSSRPRVDGPGLFRSPPSGMRMDPATPIRRSARGTASAGEARS